MSDFPSAAGDGVLERSVPVAAILRIKKFTNVQLGNDGIQIRSSTFQVKLQYWFHLEYCKPKKFSGYNI